MTHDETDAIGFATMLEDRTIVVDLRPRAEDGTIGIAQFRYPPTHPEYQEVLNHLGGLEPGQQKPVPPWPDE